MTRCDVKADNEHYDQYVQVLLYVFRQSISTFHSMSMPADQFTTQGDF